MLGGGGLAWGVVALGVYSARGVICALSGVVDRVRASRRVVARFRGILRGVAESGGAGALSSSRTEGGRIPDPYLRASGYLGALPHPSEFKKRYSEKQVRKGWRCKYANGRKCAFRWISGKVNMIYYLGKCEKGIDNGAVDMVEYGKRGREAKCGV